MDQGTLGVVVVRSGPPFHRLKEWVTRTFRVDSGSAVEVGLDGEALLLDPPLVFECIPSALRIRIPIRRHHRNQAGGRTPIGPQREARGDVRSTATLR